MFDRGWRSQNGAAPSCLNVRTVASSPATWDGLVWSFFIRRPAGRAVESHGEISTTFQRSSKLARLEAALFVAEGALSTRRLIQAATLADADEARDLIAVLNDFYDASGTAFRIERAASGYQLLTRPIFAPWLNTLHERKADLRLSPPAMETLTIVAYRQPVTRADVEAIRGVQSIEILKHLMERGLIRIAGEEDTLGRPFLYETTRKFLELFGLQSLSELPMADELRPASTTSQSPAAHPTDSTLRVAR